MPFSEKNALGRVLLISREAYLAIRDSKGVENVPALLDGLSAVLSHVNDPKKPIAKLLGSLGRGVRAKNKTFYGSIAPYLSKVYPVLDYDFDKAVKHIPAFILGNDRINAKIVSGQRDRAAAMCDAMKSYPSFLFGEFDALSDKQFYDLVFGFYPKIYGEDFIGEMKGLFVE
ncbi:MAG: hypothetical protein NC299_03915 [Lachnospiraceae bacterium]|nr:hypothetical protein [Ruminococcus sp.]MCM1274493.1 hypothetical protein [Lachnospiraceae bacterium]